MKKIPLLIIINILVSPIVYINIENVLADSNTYYVANAGSDSNNGLSSSTPWKTIGKVNTAMNAGTIKTGDDIFFKRGDTFSDTYLNVRVGGGSSNYMIIGAYGNGQKPVFNNTGLHSILLNTNGLGYITIQDLILRNTSSTSLCAIAYLTNIVISRVNVSDSGHDGIFVDDTIGLKIENCVVHDCDLCCICLYGSPSHRLSNTMVLNCTAYNSGPGGDNIQIHVDDFDNDCGSNHLIRNCTSYNAGDEDGFDISAGKNIIIDNCETWGNDDTGIVIGNLVTNVTVQNCYFHEDYFGMYIGDAINVILRNNIAYNADRSPLDFYPTQGMGIYSYTIYNNDFLHPSSYSGTINRIVGFNYDYYDDVSIKNNIFAAFHASTPDKLFKVYTAIIPPSDEVIFDTNLWWHGSGSSTNKWWNGASNMNLAGWQTYYPTDNFDNPEFLDVENAVFSLTSTSPCIDTGVWLTQTNGAGSGTTIIVDDASYFTDGYGLISGDIIFIGNDINLKITDINYNSNQITVNRSITWTNNEYVSLSSYSGSKPDIGAYEFIQNEPGPLITDIFLTTSNPLDTDPLYGWINITCEVTDNIPVQQVKINITKPDGTVNNVSMDVYGTNIYYFNSNTIFSDCGTYYYYIWVYDTNQNTITSDHYNFSMAPNWDINRDTACNILDFTLISNNYNEAGQNGWIRQDVDNNGEINVLDLVVISTHYEEEW